MGIRGEIFSTKIQFQNRTYFFNVKENRMGDLYLNIVESKNKEGSGFDRQSIVLFADDLQDFLKGFDESLKVLEKAARDKKRSSPRPADANREDERPRKNQIIRKRSTSRKDDKPSFSDRKFEKPKKKFVKAKPKKSDE